MNAILTADQLRSAVPSAFAVSPWERMSDRYKMVPTCEVVDILGGQGYRPVRAMQSSSRIEGKGAFARHMIRFRHDEHLGPIVIGTEVPELVLTNSHDGSSAYRFMAGIFRLVCSNGLTVQSADFGSIGVRHSGGADFRKRIEDATFGIAAGLPRTVARIEEWKQIELKPAHREAFAAAALELREVKQVEPGRMLAVRRAEDRKPDLWTTANVIQENLIKGGLPGRASTGRRSTTRPVKSVGEDLRLNKALWVLTEKLAAIVS